MSAAWPRRTAGPAPAPAESAPWKGRARSRTGTVAAPRRIGLLGLIGCGNTGNDGSFEAMLAFLRVARPDARLVCICSAPDQVESTYRIRTLPISTPAVASGLARSVDRLLLGLPRRAMNGLHAVRHLRRLDAIIVPGTGILDDFGTGPFGMPFALFTWCIAARVCGTRIGFVSIGAGPIRHPISRWLYRAAIRGARYRSYRDVVSKDFLIGIGFDAHDDPVFPDLAFRLPAPEIPPAASERLTVGVGVMAYYGWHNDGRRGAGIYRAYLEKITAFIRWLMACGHDVRVLTGDEADDRAVVDLRCRLGEADATMAGRLVVEPARSLHEVMGQIARTDIVVATRFHNVLCALKLSRPTISLGYSGKNDALMADMRMGEYCQHVEAFDLAWLQQRFTALAAERAGHVRFLRQQNEVYQSRLGQQELALAAALL